MKRDPRMVERKKTGLAKARKRVSHIFLVDSSRLLTTFFSTPGLSAERTDSCLLIIICLWSISLPISVLIEPKCGEKSIYANALIT